MAKQFNNRGNHFFIEVIPDIDEKGQWQGQYQLAIQARRLNIDDDSFFALEHVCQMACASLALMEDDPSYRTKVDDFLYKPDDSSTVDGKKKRTVDKIKDNVITVNFTKGDT